MKLVFKYTLEMIQPRMIYGKMFYKLLCSIKICYSHDYGNYVIASIIKCYIQSQVFKDI